jgi:hypothetical protein
VRCLCHALVLFFVALQPALAGSGNRAAVPIRAPQVETPIETAGSGLAPEVQDELFRQVTQETLSEWRYAPAIEEGRPIEAVLEWTIQFPSRDAPREGFHATHFEDSPGQAKEGFWDHVLRMKDEMRVKLLDESGTRAKRHLDAEHRRERGSRRFSVFTDHADPEIATKLAGNFEATYNVVEELLAPVVEPLPERYKVLAFVYKSRSAYMALSREVTNVDWAAGFYSPAGMVAIHLEMPTNEALLNVMLHEATHAYLDRHVARRGIRFPRWLGEGFADYVGNSTIKKGMLIPGRTTRSQIYQTSYGSLMGPSGPALTVDEVKKAVRRNEALSVPEMMNATLETFYGDKRRMYYSMSWLLVHYLRHGQPSWAESEFPTFMLYVAEGYPPAQVLEAVYGSTPSELNPAFREYVKNF